ncbi:High mobility group B protein 9 [Forsythia ovata]|uniref:High mobility group B protein 9 n=1 Tax=Forsythia ovata TaxID=205694 RepID=A0ABD1PX34_9LAMI
MSSEATIPSGNGVQGYPFPVPLATHEDVVRDPALFFSTLRTFHSATGTKFMIPVIGGKELNLHVLYIEVTKRGGYDKVVTDKKWREISGIFNFSPTTTSASYALRKHYSGLLLGFEQAYFFRHHPTGLSTFQAIGTIEGKFDCGYLISVKLGEEILSGVLYHPGNPGSSAATQYGNTVYQSHGLKDKERYQKEMEEYKERIKIEQFH